MRNDVHQKFQRYGEADVPGCVCAFAVKIRRENKIYPALSDAELERTLEQINTKSAMGKRDMAMILLGVTTGMRAIDIVNLKLSFHSLRRRIATKMVVAGVPVTTVSQVLGQMKTDSDRQNLVLKKSLENWSFVVKKT